MGIRKAMLAAALLVGIICSGFNYLHCEEEFPEWVPEEVIQKAKEALVSDETHSQFYFDMSNEELARCELRYPVKLVEVDYENYNEGDSIQKFLKKIRILDNSEYGYGFGLYLNDIRIGILEIGYPDGVLRIIGSSKIPPEAEDELALIYRNYPPDSGYKIFRDLLDTHAYFVEKDKEMVQVMTNFAPEGIRFLNPGQHMLEEKKKIIENRKFYSDPNLDNK